MIENLENINEFAIIGATASGKSKLAIELAKKLNGYILSLDSLAIYREIDIASAKPTHDELSETKHFGIDVLNPNEKFDVVDFINIYKNTKSEAEKNSKKLIIVGGTSFYLKSLLIGFSPLDKLSDETIAKREYLMQNIETAYNFLFEQDNEYAIKIGIGDRYRIEKALDILISTGISPTEWFSQNPPKAIINRDIKIFNLIGNRENLREKIRKRTAEMVKNGLIDEVDNLQKKYSREIQPAKAIGIKETLQFLDSEISKIELENLISIHTGQLAKRQETFNRTQFINFNIHNILDYY